MLPVIPNPKLSMDITSVLYIEDRAKIAARYSVLQWWWRGVKGVNEC